MPTEYDYDVFISYSHKDEEWVTKTLLPSLEKAGLKVCIDFRDFMPGRAALLNMQDAVRKSRHTLLVLSPNWFDSEWTLYESILVRTKDPAGLKLRTIPLLFQECKFPDEADFIAVLTYVDFTKPEHLDLAWRQLLTALGKPPEPEQPTVPNRDDWFLAHPYPMPPNFTGRVAERGTLSDWLGQDATHPQLVLRALGGFGKSALAWHWLTHDVDPSAWPHVVWWSFYEGDASFDHFLADTLDYLGVQKAVWQVLSPHAQVEKLLQLFHAPGTLLALDGFERVLRAYGGLNAAYKGDDLSQSEVNDCDCISPLAELFLRGVSTLPDIRSKVLLTTRLCPRVLEAKGGGFLQGCREEELLQMQSADAVAFFHAQGIRGTHTEIEQACAPYGFHPLSLRLLAGWIVSDLQQPGDIVVAKRLDVSGDLVAHKHHVLELAYDSLTPKRRNLLSRIACFRSPVKYEALKALAEMSAESSTTLDTDLRDLVGRALLHHDTKEGRFDLHPIVRRYAYRRLTEPDRAAAHTRLRNYFAAVPPPDKVARLEDLAPVIELYHHTVRAGQYDEALTLFRDRLSTATFFQLGAYQLIIDLLRSLFSDGDDRPPRLISESDQAWTMNSLANSYSLDGQPRRAVQLFEQQNNIRRRAGDKTNLSVGLTNLGSVAQLQIGALFAAEANLRLSMELCRETKYSLGEGVGHEALGRLLACRGAYAESEAELRASTDYWTKTNDVQGQCLDEAYRTQRELLLLRSVSQSASPVLSLAEGCTTRSALESALRTLKLANETAADSRFVYPVRDYVRTYWLLGAAHRVNGQTDEAEHHLNEALERCRRINMVDHEADILIDLARLCISRGASDEAQQLAEEALVITERSGYVLQGADAHLELAKLALARGDKATAREHAQKARDLATCDGPPDYTYKVAYDEAGALLEQLQ